MADETLHQHWLTHTQQRLFNQRLSQARIVVEHSFGLLKGRWRCLRNRLAVHVCEVPQLVGACCILHNICQLHGEEFDSQWLVDDEFADRVRGAFTEYFKDN